MLSDGESEIAVGIRLVTEGEVPPLHGDGLEAVAHHGFAQELAMADLVTGEPMGIVVMRCLAQEIVGAAHVHLALGLHIEKGEVERGAAGVAGLMGDVTAVEEFGFWAVGVEIGLHALVIEVAAPANKEIDGHLRTVGIEDLEQVALLLEVIAHELEAVGSLACQIGHGAFVAGDALAHEIIGCIITDLLDDVGADIGQEDEVRLWRGGG